MSQTLEIRHRVSHLDELRSWTLGLVSALGERQIILLCGPVGAGKTQFTKFLISALGGKETTSPSFAIHNPYSTDWGPVDHLDLYRLESEDDLESTGFWDLFDQEKGLILIEWADRLNEELLPRHWSVWSLRIDPVPGEPDARELTLRCSRSGHMVPQ